MVPLLGLLLVPLVVHLLKVAVKGTYAIVKLLNKAAFLLLDLVLEGGEARIKVLPHGFDLAKVHGCTLHLLDHLVLLFDAFVDLNDSFLLDTKGHSVHVHLLDFLNTLRVRIELLEAFLYKLAHNLRILLNRVFEGVGEGVLKAAEERVNTRLEGHQVDGHAIDALLVGQLFQLTTLVLQHLQVVNPVLHASEVLFNVLL